MKYIRTKDGIYDTSTMSVSSIYENGNFVKNVSYCKRIDVFTLLNIYEDDILKQADTIEELMMIDDLVFKKSGDIFVIANQAYIDYYIKHKSVSKLFIKDSKGNYIKVAEENEKGELKLL